VAAASNPIQSLRIRKGIDGVNDLGKLPRPRKRAVMLCHCIASSP
jgi:hypothetical protein